ncbi:MAG: iron-sulfur cluster assembly scaffold protein [Deltaproteobacteria bacterium]|nr:iron-sulfur cluster assembly scaffold protein [Deltaproteobacteria bacterium]
MFNKTLKKKELYGTPRIGFMENSDGYASVRGVCGDTIAIWLRIEDERIIEATYDTDGCYPSIISGKIAAQLSQGMTLEEAYQIETIDIIDAVGGLPDEFHHCAQLAAEVLSTLIYKYGYI